MRVRLIAVGRLKSGPESEVGERYLARARAAGRAVGLTGFEIVEIAEARDREAARRKDQEAAALLARIGSDTRRIVLDERGRALTSEDLAGLFGDWRDAGVAEAAILIGGPDGHGAVLRENADLVLALGPMTWPHQLVRIMISEQLYRTVTILSGHPYHRA